MDKFTQIFPTASENKKTEVLEIFNKYCQVFKINTPLRVAHFFAQVKAEVGSNIIGEEENLWYSSQYLKSTFTRYFNTYPEEAEELGYKGKITPREYNNLPSQEKLNYKFGGKNYFTQLAQENEIAKRIYCCSGDDGYFKLKQGGDQS